MTPELRDLLTALVADVRGLALVVRTIARNEGHDKMADHALLVADDARDALNEYRLKTGDLDGA